MNAHGGNGFTHQIGGGNTQLHASEIFNGADFFAGNSKEVSGTFIQIEEAHHTGAHFLCFTQEIVANLTVQHTPQMISVTENKGKSEKVQFFNTEVCQTVGVASGDVNGAATHLKGLVGGFFVSQLACRIHFNGNSSARFFADQFCKFVCSFIHDMTIGIQFSVLEGIAGFVCGCGCSCAVVS